MVSSLIFFSAIIILFPDCKLLACQNLDILKRDGASFNNYVMSNTPYQEMFDTLSNKNFIKMVKEKLKDEKIMNLVEEYLKNCDSDKILSKGINFNEDKDLNQIISMLEKK